VTFCEILQNLASGIKVVHVKVYYQNGNEKGTSLRKSRKRIEVTIIARTG